MTFEDALLKAKEKQALVGKHVVKGAVLDEVLIAPVDAVSFEDFKRVYINTLDPYKAIAPYINQDCFIIGVFDKFRIRKENLLLTAEI